MYPKILGYIVLLHSLFLEPFHILLKLDAPMHVQALTTFTTLYQQLNSKLKHKCWRVLGLSLGISLLELAITAALSLLGIALAAPATLLNSSYFQKLVSIWPVFAALAQDQRVLLLWLMVFLCVAIALKSLSLAFLTYAQAKFAQQVGVFFSVRCYERLLHAPYLWHVRQDMSLLQTRLTWARFSADFLLAALQAISLFLVACVLIGVVTSVTPWAAVLVCLATGTSTIVTYVLAQRKVQELNATSMQTEAGANQVSYPSLAGIREVKIYGQEQAFLQQFTTQRLGFARVQSMLPVIYPAPAWILDLTGMLMLLFALLVMSRLGLSVAALTGQLALLAAVTWRILPTITSLVTALLQVQQHMVYTCDAINYIAGLDAAIGKESTHTEPQASCLLQKSLVLQNVAFRYPDTPINRPDALVNLNVRIPKGSMVGFIGASGAGKSTVVGLITALLTPTSGQILIDDKPLQRNQRAAWLKNLGYVPQAPFLLNASIASNVAFAAWGQKIDYARVEHCCHMAAMDFLPDLPEGLETIIGERGVRLSGGQVQRVAIARALYSNPQLILFDEATSALDGASEQAIQHTIESLSGQVTLVLVAHRLSTVKNCDYLYWLGNGTIMGEGKPQTLLPRYEAFLEKKAAQMA
ncbi:MAG: ABC transporter ATP-binding protein [Desulfovibrionaceae bacterium]|nr:ABC transporter ATP-binding protein [Desulfovibrionaceae bacterium]